MPRNVVELLCDLIASPSVNPRLAPPGSVGAGEQQVTDWLCRFAADAGWRWGLQPVEPGRSNFFALVPGGRGDTLLWEVHQDTVSVQGMTVEPFQGKVRDGRVYGRGACDVKGSMAAMLAALVRTSALPVAERPNILLACSVNEECGFSGARAMAELWRGDHASVAGPEASEMPALAPPGEGGGELSLSEIAALRPSFALVAEPTELHVVVAHRGVARWQCTVHGRAAHSSRPEEGANAIYAMAGVVRLIEQFHRETLAARPADPWCGASTACVTTFHGGTGPNTIPDLAVVDVDRRLCPDETPEAAYRELVTWLDEQAALGECRLEHHAPWMQSRGLHFAANREWAEHLAAVTRTVGVDSRLIGVPYGTNAASIAAAGIPTAVLGPGSIAQAHTVDEWIAVDQLELAAEIYYRIACGADVA
ncbi:M20 family metallopeptidase [Lacipirellula limnantheis]|uniref:Acetylornithine deacetylase n=1 Tax=Lacipirellula limnantheis TaxID=2528024 RepID=A0A517U404_9BACT|nr:M20 family metallopeptidase [Lacipirellula limnantheis]QDT75347.1 Acetylornithine deacetylase [Lacipirellula limnantheis]